MLLKEIRLQTKHLSALYTFYNDVLELPAKYLGGKNISITAGQSQLFFEATNDGLNPFYHFAFNIPSNKFEESFQWLQSRVKLLWLDDYKSYVADFVNWHAKSVFFLDPAGNILEFIAGFDSNDETGEIFSSMQFRNISEIFSQCGCSPSLRAKIAIRTSCHLVSDQWQHIMNITIHLQNFILMEQIVLEC